MKNSITIVQGANFGSEAKGAAALALCERLGVKWAVRTGSINAGHSVMVGDRKMVFQQLPVAAVLPGVKLVIGPGAYVHEETLWSEIASAGCRDRVYIDENCGVHLNSYTEEARAAGRNLKIGATGKGCAEAIVHKIQDRGVGTPLLFSEAMFHDSRFPRIPQYDTVPMLLDAYENGEGILIEGTQGTLLDMHTGPYPYTTSRQTIASAWVAEAGLSPALNYRVVLVARTYPIRVAGNSGPMADEINWPFLARTINDRLKRHRLPPLVKEESVDEFERELNRTIRGMKVAGEESSNILLTAATIALSHMLEEDRAEVMKLFETTTVTKRLRRISRLDTVQLADTVRRERPDFVILSFLNYVFPELAPEHNPGRKLSDDAIRYVEEISDQIKVWIKYVTLGPRSEDMVEVPL